MTNDFAAAAATLKQSLALYRDLGDRAGQADALNGLGICTGSPATTRPPPPATSRRWNCSATPATGAARRRPSTSWARCGG